MKRSRAASALTPPWPTRECARVGARPRGPPPPRVPPARRGLYPARAASARNCSPETPSVTTAARGRVGLSRGDARGLRSPHGRCACARVLVEERRPYDSGLAAAFGKTFNSEGASRATRWAHAAFPQKPCAVAVRVARTRVGPKLFARRAPCRKVLCSGNLDRHAQYNGAQLEKASEEGLDLDS